MKTAFACWNARIAPVFDVARQVCVLDTAAGAAATTLVTLPDAAAPRVAQLAGLGVATLVCGAISRPLEALLRGAGIHVIAFVAGDVQEVMQAWRAGQLDVAAYAMPGCCGRRRRHGQAGAGSGWGSAHRARHARRCSTQNAGIDACT